MSTALPYDGGFLHAGPATFFGRPHIPTAAPDARVSIVGVPWDEGNGGRNGANYGPRGVRDVSSWFFSYDMRNRRDVWEALPAVDGGDVACIPGDAAQTMSNIAERAHELCAAGVLPVFVGGNHSITIGAAAGAAAAVRGRVGYLSIDAHLDTPRNWGGSPLASGCPTYRASQLPNIDPANVVVYGVHGWLNAADHIETAAELGIRWYGNDEIRERGIAVTIREALDRALDGVDALYVTVDMDSMDSSVAPGCGTPEADGFTGREAVEIARAVGAMRPVMVDIVEIAPIYDQSDITSRLVCTLILEMLAAVAAAEAPAEDLLASRDREA